MTVNPERLLTIFLQAIKYQEPAVRRAVVNQECGDDTELRGRVEGLLLGYDQPGCDAEGGACTVDTDAVPAGEVLAPQSQLPGMIDGPGARIGPYKLLQGIGEGGMGTVFMAEQVEPVRRRVALKIIKLGMDSAQVIARFEAERQALALMDHQNIARVLDAGTTATGRPYFVMELVSGVPITKYCDDSQLTPRERLELFIPVCQAIQHAHQKGIIHRDIKPSNVLVTLYDGKPVAKIIDFGVAKATDQRLTERTMFTQYGSIVGTLEYMSPEQAEMSALGVDTRSDIYSLGVLLYELLTGTTPLERAKLRDAGYAEILKRIREEEPPKPSTRLGESGDAMPSISAHRKTEPARLTRLVKGELDWIVMKALEKDRARRYETANGFAREIQRYLDGDAVEACPPSAGYRFRKFARKHRAGLTTGAGFLLLLVAASIFSTYHAVLANTARRQADAERHRADALRSTAEANFQKARQAVDEYFTKVSESKLLNVPGLQPLRKELLESSRKYYQEFLKDHSDDPSVRADAAEAWYRVGFVTMTVNSGGEAIESFEHAAAMYDALTRDYPAVERFRYKLAMCLNDLGNQQASVGLEPAARRSHERCLAIREQVVREHPDVPEYQKELGIGYGVWSIRQFHAGLLRESLRAAEREVSIFERLVREHPDVADFQRRLCSALRTCGDRTNELGRPADALRMHEQSLAIAERLVKNHPEVIDFRWDLSGCHSSIGWMCYRMLGRNEAAMASYRKALDVAEALARENPDHEGAKDTVAYCDQELGRVLVRLGKPDEALKHYGNALRHWEEWQRKNQKNIVTQRELGYVYFEIGRIHLAASRMPEASSWLARARSIFEVVADSGAVGPYNRACAQAICADLTGAGNANLSPQDQALRRKCADRAVATLREAVTGGHQSAEMIESDIDFDGLKSNENFKALLAELRAKHPGDLSVNPGS